jgi:hypothetical protein
MAISSAADMLDNPVVKLVTTRDGVARADVETLLETVRKRQYCGSAGLTR